MIGKLTGRSLTRPGELNWPGAPLQDEKNVIEYLLEETGFAIPCTVVLFNIGRATWQVSDLLVLQSTVQYSTVHRNEGSCGICFRRKPVLQTPPDLGENPSRKPLFTTPVLSTF
jgi:hypothetical protein